MTSISTITRIAARRPGIASFGWSAMSQVSGIVARVFSTLILTRLLAPKAYGIFATSFAVVTTLEWFSDLGVTPALVRHPDGLRRRYLQTGWWINLWRGVVLSSLCAALAIPLEHYYRIPGFAGLLFALSSMPLIQGLRSPGLPGLRRQLDYRSLYWIDLSQIVVGTFSSLVAAWYLRSVWAITLGTIAGFAAGTVASYVVCPTRPRWLFDWAVTKEISGLSRQVVVNTLLMAVWLNTDRLVGARYLGPERMGLYAVALNLALAFEGLIMRLGDVYFSMLAGLPNHAAKLARHREVIARVVRWTAPPLALSIVACPAIVRVVYDPRYHAAGPLLGLFLGRALLRGLAQLNYGYLLASGSIRISNVSYLAAAIVQASLVIPCIRAWGVTGLAGLSLSSTLCYLGTQATLLHLRGVGQLRSTAVAAAWVCVGLALMFGCGV